MTRWAGPTAAAALLMLVATATAEVGQASYYGGKFAGRRTASGDAYRADLMTAAHRTLPFGAYLLVTKLSTGDTCIVRVNDRGPFVRGRIVDLSRAAAEAIGMIRSGSARIRLEVVDPPPGEIERLVAMIQVLRGQPPDGAAAIPIRHVALPSGTRGIVEYQSEDGGTRQREFVVVDDVQAPVAEIVVAGARDRRTRMVRLRAFEPPPRFPDLPDDRPPVFPESPEAL